MLFTRVSLLHMFMTPQKVKKSSHTLRCDAPLERHFARVIKSFIEAHELSSCDIYNELSFVRCYFQNIN